jgi:uncharacterized RDD family membrane protein YckC
VPRIDYLLRRLAAAIIDSVILSILYLIPTLMSGWHSVAHAWCGNTITEFYATSLFKLLSFSMDGILVALMPAGICFNFFSFVDEPVTFYKPLFISRILFLGTFMLINWLYHAVLESSSRQATFGKMLFKIRVTDINGKKISFGKATIRHFAKIFSTLILCFGYLVVVWTKQKQALHDKIANCIISETITSSDAQVPKT